MATQVEALRVMRALQLVYAKHPRNVTSSPQLIPNYCVKPGISGYGITWDDGPEHWAQRFPGLRNALLKTMDPQDPNYRRVDTESYADVYWEEGILVVR